MTLVIQSVPFLFCLVPLRSETSESVFSLCPIYYPAKNLRTRVFKRFFYVLFISRLLAPIVV